MRIIAGSLGGRRIHPPANMPHTRPTTDIAREGLFNILMHSVDFSSLRTLDLFGGTGTISYELASRGVADLTVVEKDPVMHEFIRKTSAELRIEGMQVIKMDVFRFLRQCTEKFDLVFAGPPYALTQIDELPELIFENRLLNVHGLFILEHTPRNEYSKTPFFSSERKYGSTVFSFFRENRGN